MLSISLYRFVNDDIKIFIDAAFEGDSLIIEGYDIGKRVEEYWGDSDYEYSVTVPPEGVMKLYDLMSVTAGDKQGLLEELARRYHTNSAYSDIRQFLDKNKIKSEGFSWI